jgi:hypothetical protein
MSALARVALLAAIVVNCWQATAEEQSSQSHVSKVHFFVVTENGEPQPYELSQLLLTSGGVDRSDRINGLNADKLPYGEYTYTLRRTDLPAEGALRGQIVVDQPETWYTAVYRGAPVKQVGNRFIRGDGAIPEDAVIEGVVKPVPAIGKSWVRIQGVYDRSVYEVPVLDGGRFRLERYLWGLYLIFVYDEGRLLRVAPVKFQIRNPRPGPIVLELSGDIPAPIVVK